MGAEQKRGTAPCSRSPARYRNPSRALAEDRCPRGGKTTGTLWPIPAHPRTVPARCSTGYVSAAAPALAGHTICQLRRPIRPRNIAPARKGATDPLDCEHTRRIQLGAWRRMVHACTERGKPGLGSGSPASLLEQEYLRMPSPCLLTFLSCGCLYFCSTPMRLVSTVTDSSEVIPFQLTFFFALTMNP